MPPGESQKLAIQLL